MVFEGAEVLFVAIPEDEFEKKLLMALSTKGLVEATVTFNLEPWRDPGDVRLELRPRREPGKAIKVSSLE